MCFVLQKRILNSHFELSLFFVILIKISLKWTPEVQMKIRQLCLMLCDRSASSRYINQFPWGIYSTRCRDACRISNWCGNFIYQSRYRDFTPESTIKRRIRWWNRSNTRSNIDSLIWIPVAIWLTWTHPRFLLCQSAVREEALLRTVVLQKGNKTWYIWHEMWR